MQLKVNAKDVISGVFLILVALVGLYLNQDHSLGSARRMGPGYMPMMVFWIQAGLGALTVLIGLTNGPDPMDRWSRLDIGAFALAVAVGFLVYRFSPAVAPFFGQTYNAVGMGILAGFLALCVSNGWRLVGYVCAAVAAFGLLLDKGGFFVAVAAVVLISVLADRDHRPLGVAGLLGFLLVLCYWVFIHELDIRVNLWPQFS